MKARFRTEEYLISHGKEPRGRGSWAFSPDRHASGGDASVIWTPSLTYGEAKKYASKVAGDRGHSLLYVLP